MHLHLPKPLHGWRAFAGEVGIIVIGVLIALGAQQVMESIHEREDIAQLRGAFRAELADDRARWEDMRASDPCTLQRLAALGRWTATADASSIALSSQKTDPMPALPATTPAAAGVATWPSRFPVRRTASAVERA